MIDQYRQHTCVTPPPPPGPLAAAALRHRPPGEEVPHEPHVGVGAAGDGVQDEQQPRPRRRRAGDRAGARPGLGQRGTSTRLG